MIKETDHKALAVYTNLLFDNGWYLFLRFDKEGELVMLLMDSLTGADEINHFYNLKELEDWILKTKIAKKSNI